MKLVSWGWCSLVGVQRGGRLSPAGWRLTCMPGEWGGQGGSLDRVTHMVVICQVRSGQVSVTLMYVMDASTNPQLLSLLWRITLARGCLALRLLPQQDMLDTRAALRTTVLCLPLMGWLEMCKYSYIHWTINKTNNATIMVRRAQRCQHYQLRPEREGWVWGPSESGPQFVRQRSHNHQVYHT